ncbi:MAG: TIM barrel protein [Clostridia bacterium]|nr:TIM barrel protein [Clostridia bacterium]
MILSTEIHSVRKKVGDRRALALLREAGFEGIDYSFYWLPEDHPMKGEGYLAYAKELREYMNGLGLVCRQAHAPFDMKFGDAFDASNAHYLSVVRAMEAAAALGAERIVVHAVKIPQEHGAINLLDYNTEFYRSLLPYCQRFGIKVAVENLFTSDKKCGCYREVLGKPEELSELIRRLASPHFCACVDLGHAALGGIEPEIFLRRMDPSLVECLHIQDLDYVKDRHVLPFGGTLNWNGILSALKDMNYRGDVNFEIYGFLDPIPVELLPAALRYAASVGEYLRERF